MQEITGMYFVAAIPPCGVADVRVGCGLVEFLFLWYTCVNTSIMSIP